MFCLYISIWNFKGLFLKLYTAKSSSQYRLWNLYAVVFLLIWQSNKVKLWENFEYQFASVNNQNEVKF